MESRRSALDIALLALLSLAVAVAAILRVHYLVQLLTSTSSTGYFDLTDSRIATLSVKLPGIVRYAASTLLQLGGMVGIGFVLLARRRVRLVGSAIACAALALAEIDRVVLALPGQPRSAVWFNLPFTHGFPSDALQAALGLLVATGLFLAFSGRFSANWSAVLLPILVASAALQGWMIAMALRTMEIYRLMSYTWYYGRYLELARSVALSLGLLLFDLALVLLVLRALRRGSFHTPAEVLTPAAE